MDEADLLKRRIPNETRIYRYATRYDAGAISLRCVCEIEKLNLTEFHFGCCIGADFDAFDIVDHYAKKCRKIAHLPSNRTKVSKVCEMFADEILDPLPYLDRNAKIVAKSDHLYATPKTDDEEQRSGTWSTVRYARMKGIPITIFWPDGTITEEPAKKRGK